MKIGDRVRVIGNTLFADAPDPDELLDRMGTITHKWGIEGVSVQLDPTQKDSAREISLFYFETQELELV